MTQRRKPGPPSRGGPNKLVGVRLDEDLIDALDAIIENPANGVPQTRPALIRMALQEWIAENFDVG